jgi:hypothetical protein
MLSSHDIGWVIISAISPNTGFGCNVKDELYPLACLFNGSFINHIALNLLDPQLRKFRVKIAGKTSDIIASIHQLSDDGAA